MTEPTRRGEMAAQTAVSCLGRLDTGRRIGPICPVEKETGPTESGSTGPRSRAFIPRTPLTAYDPGGQVTRQVSDTRVS